MQFDLILEFYFHQPNLEILQLYFIHNNFNWSIHFQFIMPEEIGKIEGNTPNKWSILTTKKRVDPQKSELSVGWDKFYSSDYKEKPSSKKILQENREKISSSLEDLPQGKKIFNTLKPVEDRRLGTKVLRPPESKEYHRPERRHVESNWKPTAGSLIYPDPYSCGRRIESEIHSSRSSTSGISSAASTTSNADNSHYDSDTQRYHRHIVTTEEGDPKFLQRGEEQPFSKEIPRKKSVEDKRNGIGESAPGDKPFKTVEMSDNYHSGVHKKPRDISTEVSPFAAKITKHDTIAHERLMQPQRQNAQQQQRNVDIALVKALDSFRAPEDSS